MLTEQNKKAMNVKRGQKCIANKLAKMTDQQKHDWKLKQKEANRKGQANFAAKKARLAEEAFQVAETEGTPALYEARNKEVFQAAVLVGAQALYDAELKATLAHEVTKKSMSLAKAMFTSSSS
jgi:hypothetical protein